MEKKRKIECDCGPVMEEKRVVLEGNVESEALVCPSCGYRTLTRQQASKYFNLRKMKEDLEQERKVIRIGNSIGITLPEKISRYGVKIGDKVRISLVDEKTFQISVS